jgi:hypothetical protein
MTAQRPKKTLRERQLARIHILVQKAGIDDDTYRKMLVEVGGVVPPKYATKPSAAQLGAMGLAKVLDHLSKLAGEDPLRPPAGEIAAEPQLRKINALLADAKRPWGYLLAKGERGQSLLKRLTGKDRLRFCTAADLGMVIAALEIDKKRREERQT